MNLEFINGLGDVIVEQIEKQCSAKSLFYNTFFYNNKPIDDISKYQIAIVGVNDDRFKPKYLGCGKAPNVIRQYLYKLIKPRTNINIIDFGNIQPGNGINDTHFALTQFLSQTISQKITTIVIGGSQDFILSQYYAYEKNYNNVNALIVDSKADMQTQPNSMESGILPRMIAHTPNYLFNISLLGYQSYFVEPETYDTFERLNFDMMRLGILRSDITEAEPICRSAQMMGFSLNAVKAADAPGQFEPSPNGLTSDEACRIARYAGMSNEMLTAGFYDCNPLLDVNNQTSHLTAQMIWYFIEGFCNRKQEFPTAESNDYMIYRTTSANFSHEIVFFKSLITNKWWMEVPFSSDKGKRDEKYLVPCSYKDYETALNNELPDRWLKAYQKLL
ncbi:MAG: formimidoylglutamase [Bacteroidia bacterium]